MANERTRTFEGKYMTKKGESHKVKIRIFKRFATLILTTDLTKSAGGKLVTFLDKPKVESHENETLDPNLIVIEKIIEENPFILKDVEDSTYTAKVGDTLDEIAREYGNTRERLCDLNGFNNRQIIYPGQVIKTEKISEKSGVDKAIASLESYFYDYILNSPAATLAKSKNPSNKDEASFFKKTIFGNPQNEYQSDPDSIYGEFINAYMKYRSSIAPGVQEQEHYINTLTELADKTKSQLTADAIVPYDDYRNFLENRSIEYRGSKSLHS
ncbi:MAG TPA: hypothetical protein DCY94_05510 [Firmicutes bacterium]|nr:hypothetical protein [Bacillota bacterium]